MSDEKLNRRQTDKLLSAEMLSAFRAFANTQTEFMERLAGQAVNNVLESFTATFPADGVIARSWHAAAGGAVVANLAAGAGATSVPARTAGADPAAGVEATITVPAGETWTLAAVEVTLVTDATVANRRVALVIDDGVNEVWRGVASIDQTATQTIQYVGGANVAEYAAVRAGVLAVAVPPITLGPGWRIRTVTAGLVAGDNYGPPVVGYVRAIAGTTAGAVTVTSFGPGAAVPAGIGTHVVPAGAARAVVLASHQLTLYGTPGDRVSVQVFTAAVRPTAGG